MHAAEVVAGVVRMNSGGGVEQQGGGALGFAGGDLGGGANADGLGHEAVGCPAKARARPQDLGVKENARVVHEPADGNAQERVVFIDQPGDRPEVGHVGVGRLQGAHGGSGDTRLEELFRGGGGAAVDGGEVAMLETRKPSGAGQVALVAPGKQLAQFLARKLPVDDRQQVDFGAGIAAGIGVVAEEEPGLAELLLGLEEAVEIHRVVRRTGEGNGVIGGGALGMGFEPVAGLGIHHLFVVGGKQADRRGAANTAGEHGLGDKHVNIIDLDRPQGAAGSLIENALDARKGLFEREMAGRLATRGAQGRAARAHAGVVKLDFLTLVEREEKGVQGIGPTLDRVRNRVMPDRQIMGRQARGQRGEQRDVVFLH